VRKETGGFQLHKRRGGDAAAEADNALNKENIVTYLRDYNGVMALTERHERGNRLKFSNAACDATDGQVTIISCEINLCANSNVEKPNIK
jgi:hypothetical protein